MQNELKNRRQFFKEAARKSLPILGMAVLATIAPIALQSCKKSSLGCNNGCAGSCSNSCSGSCKTDCELNCGNNCKRSCPFNCKGTCKSLCGNNCKGGNRK